MKSSSICIAALAALSMSAAAASAQTKSGIDKLYILNCGEGVSGDISRWSPGVNVGKSMDFVDNCYLIHHTQGWLLWDTGVTDAIAAMPDGQAPADPKATHWRRPKTLASQLEGLGVKPADIKYVAVSHTHPDHVVYVLSGGKLRITPAGAAAQDLDLKAGQAVFLPAQEHSAENLGTTEVKLVVVELRARPTAVAPAGGDPTAVGPTIYKKVLDHERVRVLEVDFKKGAQIAAHTHPDHFAYVISAGKLRVTPVGKPAQELDVQPGQGVYLPAQAHSAQNVGASEMKGVIFEIKP
jgi:quercetin dioxygenase-like cupin family protein